MPTYWYVLIFEITYCVTEVCEKTYRHLLRKHLPGIELGNLLCTGKADHWCGSVNLVQNPLLIFDALPRKESCAPSHLEQFAVALASACRYMWIQTKSVL